MCRLDEFSESLKVEIVRPHWQCRKCLVTISVAFVSRAVMPPRDQLRSTRGGDASSTDYQWEAEDSHLQLLLRHLRGWSGLLTRAADRLGQESQPSAEAAWVRITRLYLRYAAGVNLLRKASSTILTTLKRFKYIASSAELRESDLTEYRAALQRAGNDAGARRILEFDRRPPSAGAPPRGSGRAETMERREWLAAMEERSRRHGTASVLRSGSGFYAPSRRDPRYMELRRRRERTTPRWKEPAGSVEPDAPGSSDWEPV